MNSLRPNLETLSFGYSTVISRVMIPGIIVENTVWDGCNYLYVTYLPVCDIVAAYKRAMWPKISDKCNVQNMMT